MLKTTPASLTVELEPVEGFLRAGLVFGYNSANEMHLFQAVGDRRFRAISRRGGRVVLKANGAEVMTLDAPGRIGLNVDNCKVRFRVRPPATTAPTTAASQPGSVH